MKPDKRYFIILLWFSVLTGGGLLLFTKGFLLKRLVVDEVAKCDVNFTMKSDKQGAHDGCWMHSRFKRAVIIVIDALRYDFATFNSSVKTASELPYQNKLKVIRELLRKKPDQSRLYKFVADPPTTTLQRLKGLMTGSLPTFVDAGSNFASSEINEDNLIHQLIRANKSITFMGDDTWMGLFPNCFKKAYAYPSLNVKDLHTNDNGVISHLVPELKLKDWDVLIAHFLGVDHCGHRYGPNHPAMAEKLSQMDKVLRSVIKELKQDTLLFVMGDHGMTRTGDHGGDSPDELDAALFVHSPSRITAMPPQKGHHKAVAQVDLVPTLSLLLGLPIPMANLGCLITDLFTYCPWWKSDTNRVKQIYHAVKALRLNAHQVQEYLQAYSAISDEFPYIEHAELNFLFRRCETQLQEMLTLLQIEGDERHLEENLERLRDEYLRFLIDARRMCQSIWAKFDHPSMLLGFLATLVSVLVMAYVVVVADSNWDVCCVKVYAAVVGSGWVVLFFAFLYMVGLGTTGLLASISLGIPAIGISTHIVARVLTTSFQQNKKPSQGDSGSTPGQAEENEDPVYDYSSFLSSNVASLCMLMYSIAMFSNSFVVFEDSLIAFFIPSICSIVFYQISRDLVKSHIFEDKTYAQSSSKGSKKISFDLGRVLSSHRAILLAAMIILNICVRVVYMFRACREEQWTCDLSSFLQPLSSLTDDLAGYKNLRYFLSVISMVAIPVMVHKWMRHHGNLNGLSPAVLVTLYAVPACIVCMCLYWALLGLPEKILDTLPVWQVVSLPRIVYVLVGLSLFLVIVNPLCTYSYLQSKKPELFLPGYGESNSIPLMYNHLKLHWKSHLRPGGVKSKDKEGEVPVVYGLATVYSSSVIVMTTLVALVLAMLLGDGVAPATMLQMAMMGVLLEIHAAYISVQEQENIGVPWCSIVLWGLLGSHFFFSTGHQATVTTIRWEAAYTGFHGDFEVYLIPAILITLNTFAGPILAVVGLPLLLFWPLFREHMLCVYSHCTEYPQIAERKGKSRGEFGLYENKQLFFSNLFRLMIGYMLYHAIKLIGTMAAAALHRRHLMVWKIFAPRFVFEGATWLLLSVLILLMYLFCVRINSAIDSWITKLEKSQS